MSPFIDFFGRVKDKAGDVERILKEKDRHGTVFYYCYLFCNIFLQFQNWITKIRTLMFDKNYNLVHIDFSHIFFPKILKMFY